MHDVHEDRLRLRHNNQYKCHSRSCACKNTKLLQPLKFTLYVAPPISSKTDRGILRSMGIPSFPLLSPRAICMENNNYNRKNNIMYEAKIKLCEEW